MSARDDILAAIARTPRKAAPHPGPYAPPPLEDLLQRFSTMAQAAAAEVRILESAQDIPAAVAEILRARNLPARIHLPEGSSFANAAWAIASGTAPPGPDDAALAPVPYAIAETGTLAYPARATEPASWHFRAGLEIAVLDARDIAASMEDVLARAKADDLPPTLNFVTGPSRTGDIEQTLELGAHGPKTLAILIVAETQ